MRLTDADAHAEIDKNADGDASEDALEIDAPPPQDAALDSSDVGADVATDVPLAATPPPPSTAMLRVTTPDDAIDGWIDVFSATGTDKVAVRARPSVGAQSVVTFGAAIGYIDPLVRRARFGDDTVHAMLAQHAEPVGWNFIATIYTAVEIQAGHVVRPRARHVRSTAERDVTVWDLATGVGMLERAEMRPGLGGGSELVQVSCGSWFPASKKKPAGRCPSTNGIFFKTHGDWWWDELAGESCVPRDNGYCSPPSSLPPAADFPAAIAPSAAATD